MLTLGFRIVVGELGFSNKARVYSKERYREWNGTSLSEVSTNWQTSRSA